MAFWKLTVREFRRHPGRALLTLLSIAIGIAAVVSVSLATRTTREAAQQMYEAVTGRASLEITAEGSGTFRSRWPARSDKSPASRRQSQASSGSPCCISSTGGFSYS